MRFIEILLEYKRDITKQKLGDRLVAAAQRDRTQDIDTILTSLEAMDPTTNKQYVLWLANQYIQGQFRLEDTGKVKDALEKFIKAKSRLPEKDIGRYTFYSLEDAMDKVYNVELNPQKTNQTTDQPQTFEVPPRINAQILYNGPLGLLAVPKSHKASCILGSGTRWCTTSKDDPGTFQEYTQVSPLYIWRDKNGEKYQFWFGARQHEEPQFMDAKDRPISRNLLNYFSQTHPVLKKLFQLKNPTYLRRIIGWSKQNYWDLYDSVQQIKRYLRQQGITLETFAPLLKNYPVFLAAILLFENKRNAQLEEILDLPNTSITVFDKIARNEWLSDLVEYIAKYIKQRIPALEKAILKNLNMDGGDDILFAASNYAKKIIKGNWREFETRLMQKNYWHLADYIDTGKKRFLPKLEKYIAQKGDLANQYAQDVIKTKWPEGEKAILASGGQVLDDYNKFLRRKGFSGIYRPRKKYKKKAKKKATRR